VDVDRLEQIAAQLAARVRDDEPDANRRWLHAHTAADEREALLYVLAAAVPVNVPWSHLTTWTRVAGGEDALERRRAQWRESKRRAREVA
jgi:hypothetical protein